MKNTYHVYFMQDGNWNHSRICGTLRAARKWAKWLKGLHYVQDVSIYLGGDGGIKVC